MRLPVRIQTTAGGGAQYKDTAHAASSPRSNKPKVDWTILKLFTPWVLAGIPAPRHLSLVFPSPPTSPLAPYSTAPRASRSAPKKCASRETAISVLQQNAQKIERATKSKCIEGNDRYSCSKKIYKTKKTRLSRGERLWKLSCVGRG